MSVDKQKVLYDAPFVLNRPELPWYVTVEGDTIVARWKWMDALFFSPHDVTDQLREYYFRVTLKDNGKFKEEDRTVEQSAGVQFSDGKLSFGGSKDTFKGKTNQKSIEIGIGKDRQSGDFGLIGFNLDTSQVKTPIRAYLASCGWKKAGLFG